MTNSVAFGADDEYVQQSNQYVKKDILLALILYCIMVIEFLLLGELFVQKKTELTETFVFISTGVVSLNIIGFVILFCTIRKQKLITLGFSKNKAKESFNFGMILLILVSIIGCIGANITGSRIQSDVGVILMRFIYFVFFIGFMEELVFRAYIGTRFFGVFSNKRLSIIVVGIMCSLLHIPFHMIITQISLFNYISLHWVSLLRITVFHCGFQWLYSKYNSIIAPTILHFIIDFIQWFII